METAFSRVILPLPVLFFPAIGNAILEKLRLWPKNLAAGKAIELTLCICSLTFALPMSIALFEQKASLARDDIDDSLKELKYNQFDSENGTDEYIQRFYFNKGL